MTKMEQQEKKRRARRSFTDEFRAGAVRLVLDEGKTVAQVARDLDLTESALSVWVKHARANRTKGRTGLTTAEREELVTLKKEVRELRMERDLLKNHPRASSHLLKQKLLLRYSERGPGGAAVSFLETTTIP